MRKLYIHIGTPKTGSTAIQRYSRANYEYLKGEGVDFLIRRKRAAYNDLAIYLRNNLYEDARKIGADVKARIGESDAHTFCISSEMFHSARAKELREALNLEEEFDTKIVCYCRRQDRYLESSYRQKMKTGKVQPGFANFLAKFGTGAGQYINIINAWEEAWPGSEFIFRRFEPARFPQRDVVRDFTSLFNIDIDADGVPPSDEVDNPTPSIDFLDLMHVVSTVPGLTPRSVLRSLAMQNLPRFEGRSMSNGEALGILAEFEEVNEAVRQRFFPRDEALFDMSDLHGPEPVVATSCFTDEQRALIRELLTAVTKSLQK